MSSYFVKELPYARDSAALLRQLAALDGLVFLDSGQGNGKHVHYDILSALPQMRATLTDNKVSLSSATGIESFSDDIFKAVDTALTHLRPREPLPPTLVDLPFKGGALGYFGYENMAEIGIYTWAIVVNHRQRQTVLFTLPSCPSCVQTQVLELLATDTTALEPFTLTAPFQSNFSEDSYHSAFDRVRDYIQAGDCYQVNLAQRFSTTYTGSPLAAYLRLRPEMRSPFAAFIKSSNGALLSFSPERFLAVTNGEVLTQPIKGTRPRSENQEKDQRLAKELQESEKDRAENLMIVDLLRNDLGTLCETGSVKVDKLFELQSFSNVHHLVSTISARLGNEHTAMDLLRNCFPGGSITGAPKHRAMQIIKELEPNGRAVYCGAIGYVSFDGNMDTNISIRTLLCDSPDIHCWGGGGLVADSVWDKEYQECYDKINNLINSL